MSRFGPLVLLIPLLGWALSPTAHGAASNSDARWQIPNSTYPSKAIFQTKAPTNANVQDYFGSFHTHTYAALGRLDGQGWLQFTGLLHKIHRRIHGTVRTTKHWLSWSYAVSIYPTETQADGAMTDWTVPTGSLTAGTITGRILGPITAGGVYATFAALQSGPVVVEQLCDMKAADKKSYGSQLDRVCTTLLSSLAGILASQTTPTPTPTATPTASATSPPLPPSPSGPATASPTASSTASASRTATSTDSPAATPSPTDTSTPTPSVQNITVSASAINRSPTDNSTVNGPILSNGQGIPGVRMTTTWLPAKRQNWQDGGLDQPPDSRPSPDTAKPFADIARRA